MIGRTISHFRILKLLGRGGMGTVYLAEDTRLKRRVALKFLAEALLVDDQDRERFVREARLAAGLNHPAICTVHDIETVGNQTFIVMEYVEGRSLSEWNRDTTTSWEQALEIITQAAAGLEEAHLCGIVHRDIKPGNIMVTRTGKVKILDFGIARKSDQTRITRAGTTLGSPAYMSPEQLRGEEATEQADMWGLGTVLYELLTGRPPFRGDHYAAVMYSVLNEDFVPVTETGTRIPPRLDDILHRALDKDPRDRIQSCGEFLKELDALRGHTSVSSSKTGGSRGRKKWGGGRTSRRLAIGGLLLVLLLAGVAAWFFQPFFTYPDPGERKHQQSLAVLFFHNLSDNNQNQYFSDGLTEELITRLSKIGNLEVKSRTDVLGYRDQALPVKDLAADLKVGALVEGSVRKNQGKIRVNVQLVDGASGNVLWSESYDREIDDLFAVQDDITNRIAHALELNLSRSEQRRLNRNPTGNLDAYDHYLRARAQITRWTAEGFDKAEILLQSSIERDPYFAEAYANLAFLDILRTYFNYATSDSVLQVAISRSQRALDLDPNNELALMCRSGARLLRIRNGGRAPSLLAGRQMIIDLKKILKQNPDSLLGNLAMGTYYNWVKHDVDRARGHFGRTMSVAEKIAGLEPANRMATGIASQCAGELAWIARQEGNLDYGIKLLAKAMEYTPDVSRGYYQAMRFQVENGHPREAIRVGAIGRERALDQVGRSPLLMTLAQLVAEYPTPGLDPLVLAREVQSTLSQVSSLLRPGIWARYMEINFTCGAADSAFVFLEKMEHRFPDDIYAIRLTMGSLFQLNGQLDRALAVYREVIEMEAPAQEIWIREGRTKGMLNTLIILGKQGHLDQVRQLADQWAGEIPTKSWPRDVLEMYAGRMSPEEVRTSVPPQSRETDKMNMAEVLYYIGSYSLLTGHPKQAREYWEEAQEVLYPFGKYNLGWSFNEYALVRKELTDLLSLPGNHSRLGFFSDPASGPSAHPGCAGPRGRCCHGACPTRWTRTSVSRPWKKPWLASASRKSSTPTKGVSSRATPSPAC